MKNFVFSIVVLVLSLISSYSDAYQGKQIRGFATDCVSIGLEYDDFVLDTSYNGLGLVRLQAWDQSKIICKMPNDYTLDNSNASWQWNQDNISSLSFYYYFESGSTSDVYAAVCETKHNLSYTECGTWKKFTGSSGTITLYTTSDFPNLFQGDGAPFLVLWINYTYEYTKIVLSTYTINKTL